MEQFALSTYTYLICSSSVQERPLVMCKRTNMRNNDFLPVYNFVNFNSVVQHHSRRSHCDCPYAPLRRVYLIPHGGFFVMCVELNFSCILLMVAIVFCY